MASISSHHFTLRDLVLLGVLFLTGGTLTTVWMRRETEASRQAACADKLRRLARACQEHESIYGAFPVAMPNFSTDQPWASTSRKNGVDVAGPNWAVQLLGALGEHESGREVSSCLAEHWNAADECPQYGKLHVGQFRATGPPPFFSCPAALPAKLPHESALTGFTNLAKGNYAACVGAGTYVESLDCSYPVATILRSPFLPATQKQTRRLSGVITVQIIPIRIRARWDIYGKHLAATETIHCESPLPKGHWKWAFGKGVKLRRIKDGLAGTMLLSEVLTVDGSGETSAVSEDIRGVWVTASMGGSTYSHFSAPNSQLPDRINGCENDPDDLPSGSSLRCTTAPATGAAAGDTFAAARSNHIGGVMGAMADGSVHFYSNEIDLRLWRSLATRAGRD